MTVLNKNIQGKEQEEGKSGGAEGKLNGNYLRLIPGLYLEDRRN